MPASVPALNPGIILPSYPSMLFLGVNESLENIPSSTPLLYKLVITRVWLSVSRILVTRNPDTP